MKVICAVSVFTCALFTYIKACSPGGEEYMPKTIPQKVHMSDTVITGKVVEHLDSQFGSTAFNVRVLAYCVIKGDPQIQRQIDNYGSLTINEAGYIPGMCHSTTLDVGGEYIIYLNNGRPWMHEDNATTTNLRKAASACGLQMFEVPQGMKGCPPPVAAAQCKPKKNPGGVLPPSIHEDIPPSIHEGGVGTTPPPLAEDPVSEEIEDGLHHENKEDESYSHEHESHHDDGYKHDHDHDSHHSKDSENENEVDQSKGKPEAVIGSNSGVNTMSHVILSILSFLIIVLIL